MRVGHLTFWLIVISTPIAGHHFMCSLHKRHVAKRGLLSLPRVPDTTSLGLRPVLCWAGRHAEKQGLMACRPSPALLERSKMPPTGKRLGAGKGADASRNPAPPMKAPVPLLSSEGRTTSYGRGYRGNAITRHIPSSKGSHQVSVVTVQQSNGGRIGPPAKSAGSGIVPPPSWQASLAAPWGHRS